MLPFALKCTWFVLCLTGLIASSIVLYAFGRSVRSYWAPALYLLGTALLQINICLGMIWKMDPFQMPRGFCYAQAIIAGYSACLITGVTTSFSMATCYCIGKPKTWNEELGSILRWRRRYLIPVLVCPLVAIAIHTTVVVKLGAVVPSDGMLCGATKPLWIMFLGFAGFPFIIALPGVYYSVLALVRLRRIHQHIRRSRSSESGSNGWRNVMTCRRPGISGLHRPLAIKSDGEPRSPKLSALSVYTTALPDPQDTESSPDTGTPDVPVFATLSSSAFAFTSNSTEGDHSSDISDSLPTFAPFPPPSCSSHAECIDTARHGPADFDLVLDHSEGLRAPEPRRTSLSSVDSRDTSGKTSTIQWARPAQSPDSRDAEFPESKEGIYELDDRQPHARPLDAAPWDLSLSREHRKPRIPRLAPAVRRIIIFQVLVIVVAGFAGLSTLIDIISHPSYPTPFGTHYVALIMEAWGPVVLFAPLPAVRAQFKLPWRVRHP